MQTISLAIHGGAGTLVKGMMTPELETAYRAALQKALDAGYELLAEGKSAVEAVEQAVILLENSHLFNAGKGSVFTAVETHEMDAAIMEGKTLNAGAVSLITGIAMHFAKIHDHEIEDPSYFYDEFRHNQWLEIKDTDSFQLDHSVKKDSKFGTVGAVACDIDGNIAAATSTGGMTNKRFGRVGDSPMIGAGNYANNETCAISCTGSGEYFIRGVVAYDVSCLMEHKEYSLEKAADLVINERILKLGGDGGLIAIDAKGNIAMPFNTEGMYRACKSSNGTEEVSIYK